MLLTSLPQSCLPSLFIRISTSRGPKHRVFWSLLVHYTKHSTSLSLSLCICRNRRVGSSRSEPNRTTEHKKGTQFFSNTKKKKNFFRDYGTQKKKTTMSSTTKTPSPKKTKTSEPLMLQPSSSSNRRKIGIAVDLSDESAYAVEWAVQNYLRPGDSVVLLHVSPTPVLYGADWGSTDISPRFSHVTPQPEPEPETDFSDSESEHKRKLEKDFDLFTTNKANELARPLLENDFPFKLHIVKDHDLRERLCLEVERLGLTALVTGSRGFGASSSSRKGGRGRLGSVSDYCVHHCVCPVIVVRVPDEKVGDAAADDRSNMHPLVEEEEEEEEAESCVVNN